MTKKYEINGIDMYFDFNVFNDMFIKNKEQKKIGLLEQELADFLHISKDAVHSWRNCIQSPNDLEIIKNIAKYYNLTNYESLLIVKGEVNNIDKINNLQIESIKRIYDSIIEHLEYFEKTNGYNDLWHLFVDMGIEPKYVKSKLYDVAESKLDKVMLCYKKERMLLKNTEIYKQIGIFIYNDLYDIFDNKLDYGYRYEAGTDGIPTTDEDYNKALGKINSIIDKYI